MRIFHPFLLAAYPAIALLAYNIEVTQFSDIIRPLLLSLLVAVVMVLLIRLWLHNWLRAALITTLALAVFFSYGHVYNYLEQVNVLGIALGRHRLLIPIWLVLFCLGMWWASRKRRDLPTITRTLNIIMAVALVFPLAQIALFGFRTIQSSASQADQAAFAGLHLPTSQPAPDIYYIILDGYSRDDMLAKFYQYDNSIFLNDLKEKGFYVAPCSQSNYAQTQLSLASSLNFNYLTALGSQYTPDNTSRVGLAELIKHSTVRRAFESLGYRTIAFETGFEATQLEDANPYLASGASQGMNDFENLFLRTTAGRIFAEGVYFLNIKPDWEARDEAHREQILFTLKELSQIPEMPGPKFVFAHIVSPHWPHVFGPNGEKVHERQDSISGYRDQVIFINKQIDSVIQVILARSTVPPIIVVQGDHGAVIESPNIRMAIFNAYHLPGDSQQLYEKISPVNTFRLILNQYFGGNFNLLEDKAYYSHYATPYDFTVVPNTRRGCSEN